MKTRSKKVAYKVHGYSHGRLHRKKRTLEMKVARAANRPTRKSAKDIADLSALTAAGTAPSEEPDVELTRRGLRSQFVPCHHYGIDREMLYPEYFFCSPCKLYEDHQAVSQRKIKDTGRRWACQAHHKFFAFPSEKKAESSNMEGEAVVSPVVTVHNREEVHDLGTEAETEPEQELGHDKVSNTTEKLVSRSVVDAVSKTILTQANDKLHLSRIIQEQETQIETLQTALLDSDEEIAFLRRKLARAEHKLSNSAPNAAPVDGVNAEPADELAEELDEEQEAAEEPTIPQSESRRKRMKHVVFLQSSIEDAIVTTRLRNKDKIDSIIAEAVWSHEFRNGGVFKALMKLSSAWLRKNVFPPWKVLKVMDDNGGKASYESCELFRSVETEGEKYYRGSILPCAADLKRAAKVLEREADKVIPLTQSVTASGAECVSLEPISVLRHLLKAFGLEDEAKIRSIEIALALDAANLTKYLSHTTEGIKFTDHGARDPKTNMPLLSRELTGDDLKAQSSTLCFPIRMIAEGETHESVKEFASDYALFDSLTEEGQIICPEIKNIRLTTEGDLSLCWKGLKRGGATKVFTNPCTCCAITSANLVKANTTRCTRWCNANTAPDEAGVPPPLGAAAEVAETPQERKCYHHDLVDEERLAVIGEQMKSLEEKVGAELAEIDAKTRIDRRSNVVVAEHAGEKRNPVSIHFEPISTAEKKAQHKLFKDELRLRNLSTQGSRLVRQDRLRKALIDEIELKRLIAEFFHCSPKEGALFQLARCVPCLLHLENRVGLKIVYMLMVEGLSNCKEGLLYEDVEAEGARVELFLSTVQTIVNTSLIGIPGVSGQWRCPYSHKDKEIGIIKFSNTKTRRFVAGLEDIIEICVVDPTRQEKWNTVVHNYRLAIEVARMKEDYTDEDIVLFQHHVDNFFHPWLELTGMAGMTNYIHMLSSGHVAEYMHKYRNLYRHSQQGWEQLNDVIKTFFFRRTSRGGATNRGTGLRKRLLPVGRFFQRRLMWLITDGDDMERYAAEQKEDDDRDYNGDDGDGDDIQDSSDESDYEPDDGFWDDDASEISILDGDDIDQDEIDDDDEDEEDLE